MGENCYIIQDENTKETMIIDELYNRMVNIFAGNVSAEDVDFLAIEQKVKALLVLAQDGLYSNDGALTDKYNLVHENEYYKVYVLK